MKRLYIVVEGQTEEVFVKSVLAPHLQEQGILFVKPIAIHGPHGARGGMVSYERLKNNILPSLGKEMLLLSLRSSTSFGVLIPQEKRSGVRSLITMTKYGYESRRSGEILGADTLFPISSFMSLRHYSSPQMSALKGYSPQRRPIS